MKGRVVSVVSLVLAVAALGVAAWAVVVAEDARDDGTESAATHTAVPDRVVGTLWRCKLLREGRDIIIEGPNCRDNVRVEAGGAFEKNLEVTVATALGTTYRVIVQEEVSPNLGDTWPTP